MSRYQILTSLALIGLLSACEQSTPSATPSTEQAPARGLQTLAQLNDQAPARRALNIQQWHTEQGTQVLFVAAPQLPMFDLRLTFAAGSSQDGEQAGLATLTNAMLNEGVPGKDVTAIAAGFENLGAQFSSGAYRDMGVISLRSLSAPEQREAAVSLLLEILRQPTFPEDSLARIQNQLLAGFEQQKRNPAKLGQLELFERLYGEHPYAHPSEGNPDSITTISRDDLIAFYQRAYTAANASIAIVGDLTLEQAQNMAAQISAALPQGPALPKVATPAAATPASSHIEFPSEQTHLSLAQLSIERGHPDYPALYLGNQILGGGGFGSRLMEEVREKRGLTYGVYSGINPMQTAGPFSISLQTRADQSEGTLALIKEVLADFIANGPTEEEVQQAKRELTGSFPLSTASNASIVGQLGAIGFYNLPLTSLEDFVDQVQALSREQVQEAMARHLDVDKLVIVSVGPSVEQKPLPEPTRTAPAVQEHRH